MKQAVIAVAVIVIAVVAWLAFGGKNNTNNQASNSQSGSTSQNTSAANSNAQPVSTDKVSISNFTFSPADISVKKGTKVTWTNNDSITHTVTGDNGSNGPSSGNLDSGQSYSFTFNQVGSFHYHCSIHPGMTGTVTVTE